ncbi:GDP-L-fucose synthase [Gramella sp. BOM4]|nr:GDP-L-fucose synthase [Christiangramia bathymodioli]
MELNSKIYVAGHKGLVGRAIYKTLKVMGYSHIITRSHKELDLTDCNAVDDFFSEEKPEYVFLAAAKVGGIEANDRYRGDFLYENLMIQTNVIHQSYLNRVKKLLFLGSTCVYPKNCPQPIKEEYLLTGSLEYTNEAYAIAKIAGIKMCESYNLQYGTDFLSVMPTNLYGPGDNFDLEKSHVLPAILRKMYIARLLEEGDSMRLLEHFKQYPLTGIDSSSSLKETKVALKKYGIYHSDDNIRVEIWGSGSPLREFLWSEDMAQACVYVMNNLSFLQIVKNFSAFNANEEVRNVHLNIGTGKEISIKDLAYLVKEIVGFNGEVFFNTNKKDGTPRKVTDTSKIKSLGWEPTIDLREGIKRLLKYLTGNKSFHFEKTPS